VGTDAPGLCREWNVANGTCTMDAFFRDFFESPIFCVFRFFSGKSQIKNAKGIHERVSEREREREREKIGA
jgi:hypothetical protein